MAHKAEVLMDITSANTVFTIQADSVIPNPVQLQNFSTDQLATVDEQVVAESRMGVDGGLAIGYVPQPFNFSFMLEANSPSQDYMFNLADATRANRCTYDVTITLDCPSLKRRYIFERGGLINASVMPNPKKTHDPTTWKFVFASARVESIEAI